MKIDMPLKLANFEKQAREAVKAFWGNREAAAKKQREAGKIDAGNRSAVTGGKNMDGFLVMIDRIIKENGLKNASVHMTKRLVTLPGYFRPTKQWDMLVMNGSRLVAALELKSQVGSFGNNFNNRTEEALGTALDLSIAFREGSLGDQPKPFVGWLMLLEDCPGSRKPVNDFSPHFALMSGFEKASYADRYKILCEKLVKEDLYASAALLLSSRKAVKSGAYLELSELTSLFTFVSGLAAAVAKESARESQK